MEQLMGTPIFPVERILGKTIPFIVISLILMIVVTAIAIFQWNV